MLYCTVVPENQLWEYISLCGLRAHEELNGTRVSLLFLVHLHHFLSNYPHNLCVYHYRLLKYCMCTAS